MMIKLNLPTSERVWAETLGKNTARLQNIPLIDGRFCLDDIVIYDGDNVVRLKKRVNRNKVLGYKGSYRAAAKLLTSKGIECVPLNYKLKLLVAAVPVTFSEIRLKNILSKIQ